MDEQLDLGAEIIPANLAITAMKDSGYKNTAYALAEIIDNAAQAEATLVEVFCLEEWQIVSERRRRRIKELGVLDNGNGMDRQTLRMALQFGNGTRLNSRSGIGRFGMGLPNSSISQADRVQVWTWQGGAANALYTYLDVEEIAERRQTHVPEPRHEPLPEKWRDLAGGLGQSGTLVVWDKIDQRRLTWKTGKSTLENTARIAGRMYRKFIDSDRLDIRMRAVTGDGDVTFNEFVLPNDPMYLIAPSATPSPFGDEPMFQMYGEKPELIPVRIGDERYDVTVRLSWARPETNPDDGTDRGNQPYGKHAAKNIGVSIVRADREIQLDSSWANSYNPSERWWGAEIEFPPALDEIFGVTNNKQAATVFAQMSQFDWEKEAEDGESFMAFKERLREDGDPRVHLIDIVDYLQDQLSKIRGKLKDQNRNRRTRSNDRHDGPSADDAASAQFRKRSEEGHQGIGDGEVFDEEAVRKLMRDLQENKHFDPRTAQKLATSVMIRQKKAIFLNSASDSLAFFQVESKPGGLTEIIFNTRHEAYDRLVRALDEDVAGATDADLVERIENASLTLRMLFAAWARYEIEDMPNRSRIQEIRHEWGKMARAFLEDDNA